MIEEIGEIFYTLVVGYIGALELCYIAKHIYHLSHQCIYQENEESRLQGLQDIQEKFKKAVAKQDQENKEKQIDGNKNIKDNQSNKDSLFNKDNQLNNINSLNKDRLLQEGDLSNKNSLLNVDSPVNKDKLQNEDNLLKEDRFNENESANQSFKRRSKREINSTQLPVNDEKKNNEDTLKDIERDTFEKEKDVQEEKILQRKINESESLEINLESVQAQNTINENEIHENLQREQFVVDSIAKNNDTNSLILQEEHNTQISETKIEGRFNITDLSESELQMSNKINENKINESKLIGSDVNDIIKKETSAENKLDDINEINVNESSRFIIAQIQENENLEENISLHTSSNSTEPVEIQSAKKDFSLEIEQEKEAHNEKFSSLETKIQSENFTTQFTSQNEWDEVEKEIEILEHFDSESSADEEGNSISSVIEKTNLTEEDDNIQYKLILTEEEKEKVINSKAEDMNFKDISEVLKSSDIVKGKIVEAALQEDSSIEDMVEKSEPPQREDGEYFSSYYEDDTANDKDVNAGKGLRRSPRVIEIDHYEERWQNVENEQVKRNKNDENERFIAEEQGINYSSLKSEDNSNVSNFLEQEQNSEAEILSQSQKSSKAGRPKLFVDVTKHITNKDQNWTPKIELFDESGKKTPSVDLIDEPRTPFTPSTSSSVMEGLSDFYDFNASINPSRSPSLSRSSSVQPLSPAFDNKSPPAKGAPKTPSSLTPNIPENIENLSDFYDFNVKINQTIYSKKLSFGDDDTSSKNFLLKELNNEIDSSLEGDKDTSPTFNYSFRELKMLSQMPICSPPMGKILADSICRENTSTEIIKPDSNFMRSQYVGASADYSYDFEDLREQARNFIRSRSPSLSFGDDVVHISAEDYRKEVQDNILRELQEKSLNYDCLEVNKELVDRERRESDTALLKKKEIIFQIQDESDFIASQDKYVYVEDIEIEPEEYHHFRRFSMQQEYYVEEYPDSDFACLNKEAIHMVNSESFENFQDNVVDLEQLSLYSEEPTEIILKTIKENVALDGNIEGNTKTMEGKNIRNILEDDDLDQVDLEYVPKKEYSWRKNFKLDDDENEEKSAQKVDEDDVTKIRVEDPFVDTNKIVSNSDTDSSHQNFRRDQNSLNDENNNIVYKDINDGMKIKNNEEETFTMIEANDIQNASYDEGFANRKEQYISNHSDSEQETLNIVHGDENKDLKIENLEKLNVENPKIDNQKEEDIDEESFDVVDAKEIENFETNIDSNADNKCNNVVNDGGYGSTEKICYGSQMAPELSTEINLNEENKCQKTEECNEFGNENYELKEEGFDLINAEELHDITDKINSMSDSKEDDNFPEEKELNAISESEDLTIDNGITEDPNNEYNYLEAVLDADDGIDEVIYDYNDRPDESYNQSECGENNNDDIEEYESQESQVQNNSVVEQEVQSQNNGYILEIDNSGESMQENEPINVLKSTEEINASLPEKLISDNNSSFENELKPDNVNLEQQFDEMYDDFIKNRRESRIEKDYNGIVEKMNKNYNDDTASITTDEIIEQIYFKDLSPSRYERLGSEDSLSSSYSSLSQGSLNTRSKFKGISHARQIKSDRLRTRYGIAPAIGTFASFENTDDTPISYVPRNPVPRKEYNWRKNFKLDDLDSTVGNKKAQVGNNSKSENDIEINGKHKNELEKDTVDFKSKYIQHNLSESFEEQRAEGFLNKKINTMYDEVLKNRRKSRIEKEFEEIAEEMEIKTEELNELDSVPTEDVLKEILVITDKVYKEAEKLQESENNGKKIKSRKKSRKNSNANFINETTELADQIKPENNEYSMNAEKIKETARKNSTIVTTGENNSELTNPSIETFENIENAEKPKKKKSSRKSSLVSNNIDGGHNDEIETKLTKKNKKSKKRHSIEESAITQTLDFDVNNNYSTEPYDITESYTTPQKIGTPPNTPSESITDDAEKYSNRSISNSSLSLISSQARLDRIGVNDILELIRDSSILGSSF